MDSDPFVCVGGDAAGLSAASKARREDPDREVVVLEKGQWVSYAHCGTPYYVKGAVDRLTDLLSLRPDEVAERGIDLRRGHEVVDLDPDRRVVTVAADGDRYDQPYGDLLVGTGARARQSVEGVDLTGAFTLHGLDDAAAVRAYLTDPDEVDPGEYADSVDRSRVERYGALAPPSSAAVVGGGYVGVEVAEAFAAHDLDVTLFQRAERLLPPFGEAVGARVAEHLRAEGVTVETGVDVERLVPAGDSADGRLGGVETAAGRVDVDVAMVGVGVVPNVDPVADALELGASGAVATDRYGRTSREDVYAAGDCAEAPHAVTGESAWIPLGLTANRAGRAVGATVAGDPTPVGPTAGTAVLKAFELGAGRTGLLEAGAREAGFEPVSTTITAGSRSGYYPGAEETTVTLVADEGSGRVLGAATVGADRAAKRVDTVATALAGELTVAELERTDLGYAPPFSPVWDPVLVAAKVLRGRLAD
jgi:NADPH-dependent 2,4-dienoyl-CoA reductase/sulfur reductase-like enzyme